MDISLCVNNLDVTEESWNVLLKKELDFGELHNECKKIEQNAKAQQKNKRLPTSSHKDV
ncbi:Uncharacterized protein APZ42_024965 [Daphnia magna]|uniref:Uncharacterized protein n=1 Tax=Daphnia magna TaxID=35525 RepID=A0A164TL45_9CRUS|nr:Uncharacterized protein APZ42_024965 [Daphnia magna]